MISKIEDAVVVHAPVCELLSDTVYHSPQIYITK